MVSDQKESAVNDLHYQMLLLPERGECAEMFYHTPDAVQQDAAGLHLPQGARITFDAYYNLFPALTYRKYTVCTTPELTVRVQGNGTVCLNACAADGAILAQERADFAHPQTADITLKLTLPAETAAVYWSCQANAQCTLSDAFLTFAEAPVRTVTLAVGICTYCREEFVLRNAALIDRQLARMPDAPHRLFIADNGGTLAGQLPASARVQLVTNPNTGGSGGFARTMQETLCADTAFTHLLLMDDDISFRPEILERLVYFLSHCRTEYAHVTVGGAMCLLDAPWMQFEAGALFLPGGVLNGLMQNLDLRKAENCIYNVSAPHKPDYNSWWCCCMSVEKIREAGLPMPFFFKMDDVEYALRLGQPVVCLPGLCVAHEDFVRKYNPALEYYITRNTLFTAAMHGRQGGKADMIRRMLSAVLRSVLLQRYDTAELILRAYHDFLRGTAFLGQTDPAALHHEILQSAPSFVEAPEGTQLTKPVPVSGWLRMLSLGGMLLPCNRESSVVDAFFAGSAEGFRVRELLHFSPKTKTGYRTRLCRARAAKLLLRTCCMALRLLFVRRSLCTQSDALQSMEFWEKYNHINS